MYVFLLIAAFIGLAAFWVIQVVTLMRMDDAVFPGRYDKPAWAILMSVTFVLGAAAFAIWLEWHMRQRGGD